MPFKYEELPILASNERRSDFKSIKAYALECGRPKDRECLLHQDSRASRTARLEPVPREVVAVYQSMLAEGQEGEAVAPCFQLRRSVAQRRRRSTPTAKLLTSRSSANGNAKPAVQKSRSNQSARERLKATIPRQITACKIVRRKIPARYITICQIFPTKSRSRCVASGLTASGGANPSCASGDESLCR